MTDELVLYDKKDERVQVAKRTIAKSLNDDEFEVFLYDCSRYGVHPLDKLIIPTIRTDKNGQRTYTRITTVDYLRSRADQTGLYAGNDDPIFDNEENPQRATVTVYKMVAGQRVPYTATARWKQYVPDQGKDFMWKKMPHVMLGKCAEALALRKAFPQQLGGLYTKDEMEQADAPIEITVVPQKPTPEVMAANADIFGEPEPNAAIPEIKPDAKDQFAKEFTESASKATYFLELATLVNQYIGVATKLGLRENFDESVKLQFGRLLQLHEDADTLVEIPNEVPLPFYCFFYAMDEVGRKSGYPGMKTLYYQLNDVMKAIGLAKVWKDWCAAMKKEIEGMEP